ncbi:hypothetical protein DFS34DRAFT_648020 [Phlyctochytrium arcticum]|nr:hypothetical protein DFS34DRAFT_648020 [Phlyctochytrium arcticum]
MNRLGTASRGLFWIKWEQYVGGRSSSASCLNAKSRTSLLVASQGRSYRNDAPGTDQSKKSFNNKEDDRTGEAGYRKASRPERGVFADIYSLTDPSPPSNSSFASSKPSYSSERSYDRRQASQSDLGQRGPTNYSDRYDRNENTRGSQGGTRLGNDQSRTNSSYPPKSSYSSERSYDRQQAPQSDRGQRGTTSYSDRYDRNESARGSLEGARFGKEQPQTKQHFPPMSSYSSERPYDRQDPQSDRGQRGATRNFDRYARNESARGSQGGTRRGDDQPYSPKSSYSSERSYDRRQDPQSDRGQRGATNNFDRYDRSESARSSQGQARLGDDQSRTNRPYSPKSSHTPEHSYDENLHFEKDHGSSDGARGRRSPQSKWETPPGSDDFRPRNQYKPWLLTPEQKAEKIRVENAIKPEYQIQTPKPNVGTVLKKPEKLKGRLTTKDDLFEKQYFKPHVRKVRKLPWQGDIPIEQVDPLTVDKPHKLLFSKLTDAFGGDPNKFIHWLGGLNDAAGRIYFNDSGEGPRHIWEITLPKSELNSIYYIKMMMRYSVVRDIPDDHLVWRCTDPAGLLRMCRMLKGQSRVPDRQSQLRRLCTELGHPELFGLPEGPLRKLDSYITGFFEARGRLRVSMDGPRGYAVIRWHEPEMLLTIRRALGVGRVIEDTGEDNWISAEPVSNFRRTSSSASTTTAAKQGTSATSYALIVDKPSETEKVSKQFAANPFKGTQAIDLVKWNRALLFIHRGYHLDKSSRRFRERIERLMSSLNTRIPMVVKTVGTTPLPRPVEAIQEALQDSQNPAEKLEENGWVEQENEPQLRATTGRPRPTVGEPGFDPEVEIETPLTKKQRKLLKMQRAREVREILREKLRNQENLSAAEGEGKVEHAEPIVS